MIRFSEPGLLFLLPLLILLAVAGVSVMLRRAKRWDLLAAARLKHRLVDSPGPAATFGVLAFWGFAAVMLVLALARPEVPLSRVETTTHPSPVMFLVIDLSRSMRVQDVPPDRLTVAKLVARDMLESHAGAQIGLVSFAGRAVTHVPPTLDHRGVAEVVREMDETWPEIGGTNIAGAIRHTVREAATLEGPPPGIILLSDGEEHAPDLRDALDEAVGARMPVLAIGFGTTEGGHVPYDGHPGGRMLDRSGRPVVSRMEPDILEKIALTTSGARHIHRHHETTLGAIRDFVSRLETDIIESERESATLTLHPVPLALALASFLTGLVLDVATGRRRHGHQVTGSAPAVAGR